MNKILLTAGVVIIALGVGFLAVNAYIYEQKQELYPSVAVEPYRVTLTGEYLCLPPVDETGPQTDECAYGIKTETGEYYAVDLNLMSQSGIELEAGESFTANGVITPIEHLSTDHWKKYPILGIFSVTNLVVKNPTVGDEPQACQADAKICPDGSAVGRSGPRCEFAACPAANATSARATTYVGGTVTALNVSVSPKEIISDSRCPADVACVWAGTVEVRTTLATAVAHGEHVLTLGQPQQFGEYTVTLVEVTPAKTKEAIVDASYRLTFEIVKGI